MTYEPINLFYAYIFGLSAFSLLVIILKFITATFARIPNKASSIIIFIIWIPAILKNIITNFNYGKIVEIALIISILFFLFAIDRWKIKYLTNQEKTKELYKNKFKLLLLIAIIFGAVTYQII
jgi:hypothetical protein